MPNESKQAFPIRYPIVKESKESPKFPSTRYFQVHFEYLESLLNGSRSEMEKLRNQVAILTEQIAKLNSAVTKSNKSL